MSATPPTADAGLSAAVDRDDLDLTVVAPVFNEAKVISELVTRIDAACRATTKTYEIVIADDCSTDDTGTLLTQLCADPRLIALRHERLPENRGQWGATAHGMSAARGSIVLTIDGDLQDPPELIGAMVAQLDNHPAADVCFAVKTRRDDPLWFRAGMTIFVGLQRVFARSRLPAGAGAYVAMRGDVARRAARVGSTHINLAPVLAALRVQTVAVPYEKQQRYDGESRVGPWGLVKEATGSLIITGAMERMITFLGIAVFVGYMISRWLHLGAGIIAKTADLSFVAAIALLVLASVPAARRKAAMGPARSASSDLTSGSRAHPPPTPLP